MNKARFRALMIIIGVICVIELVIVVAYPIMNRHDDILTIEGHDIYGGLYHVRTDGPTLNVSVYYRDILKQGNRYQIIWVDGIKVDRIVGWREK